MKRILTTIFALTAAMSLSAQFTIGVRDTRYPFLKYRFLKHFDAKVEHSVYSEKWKYQYVRLYLGADYSVSKFTFRAEPYFGTTYGDVYYSTGAYVGATARPIDIIGLEAAVVPHYDSGLGYTTCYNFRAGVNIIPQLAVQVGFTNRPEYRLPERRLRAGLHFEVGKLNVTPELSIPVSSEEGKNVRVLMSMAYTF